MTASGCLVHLPYVVARMGQAKEVEVVSDSELVGAAREGDAASRARGARDGEETVLEPSAAEEA